MVINEMKKVTCKNLAKHPIWNSCTGSKLTFTLTFESELKSLVICAVTISSPTKFKISINWWNGEEQLYYYTKSDAVDAVNKLWLNTYEDKSTVTFEQTTNVFDKDPIVLPKNNSNGWRKSSFKKLFPRKQSLTCVSDSEDSRCSTPEVTSSDTTCETPSPRKDDSPTNKCKTLLPDTPLKRNLFRMK